MAISQVQATVIAALKTATFASPPTPGNLLICIAFVRAAGTLVAPTSGTWLTAIDNDGDATNPGIAVFYKIAGVGESSTVTYTSSTATAVGIWIAEYTGVHATTPFDVSITATGSTAAPASGNLNTNGTDKLLLSAIAVRSTTTLSAPTNGFAIEKQVQLASGGSASRGGVLQLINAGDLNSGCTSGSAAWRCSQVAFNPAATVVTVVHLASTAIVNATPVTVIAPADFIPLLMDCGTDETFDTSHWTTIAGTVTSASDQAKTGPRSLKCDTGAGAATASATTAAGILADTGRRIAGWLRFDTLPSADGQIMVLVQSGATSVVGLALRTTGVLQLQAPGVWNVNGTIALSPDNWPHVAVSFVITSTTVYKFVVYVNGYPDIIVENAEPLAAIGTSRLRVQAQGALGTNYPVWWDNVYVDDGDDCSFPGFLCLTAKRGIANGSVNAFDTTTSTTNSGYGTGNAVYVNERAAALTGARRMGGTGAASERYTIEDAATGDVNLTGLEVKAIGVWAHCSGVATDQLWRGSAVAPHTPVSGTAGARWALVQADTYPTALDAIGMHRPTGSATDALLNEVGLKVAFLELTRYVTTPAIGSGSTLSVPAVAGSAAFITTAFIPPPYVSLVLADGPTHYWQLNETSGVTARTRVGSAHGTISGSVLLNQPGVRPGTTAMDFSGNGTISIPNIVVNDAAGTFTMEAWTKAVEPQAYADCFVFGPNQAVTGYWLSALGYRTFLGEDSAKFSGNQPPGTSLVWVSAASSLVATFFQAHHIVATYASGTITVYVDGVLAATQSGVALNIDAASTYAIGDANQWTGLIQDVALYPLALTPTQVATHYTAGLTASGVFAPSVAHAITLPFLAPSYASAVAADGAIRHWRLNELSGTTATDRIGTSHGTISGGVTLGVTGVLGGPTAMTFNGTTGKITIPPIPSIANPFTFEAWILFDHLVFFEFGMALARPTWSVGGFMFGFLLASDAPARHRIVNYMPGQLNQLSDPVWPLNGIWHHIVYTYNGTVGTFYGDAVGQAYSPSVLADDSASVSPWIGLNDGVACGPVTLQDIAVYPQALTPAQITNHYALGSAPSGLFAPTVTLTLTTAFLAPTAALAAPTVIFDQPITTAFIYPPYARTVIADGASHYWRLNEISGTTAVDLVGTAHGTIAGGVTLGVSGPIGTAMTFDGAADGTTKIQIPNTPFPAPPITFELWFKTLGGGPSTQEPLFSTYITGPSYVIRLYPHGGTDRLRLDSSLSGPGENMSVITTRKVYDNRWHHLVWVVESTGWTCYIDSTIESLQWDTPFWTAPAMAPQALYIGSSPFGDSFPGGIDEVSIYPLALTPTQIANHAAGGLFPPTVVQTVALTFIATATGSFAPTVVPGALAIATAALGSTLTLAAPSVITDQPITTTALGAASAVFAPTVIIEQAVTLPTIYCTYVGAVLADGATTYWRLGDTSGSTAIDAIGSDDGVISGGVTLGQPGAIAGDTAMHFDGAAGRVAVPHGPFMEFGTTSVSIEWWQRASVVPGFDEWDYIFDTLGPTDPTGVYAATVTDGIQVWILSAAGAPPHYLRFDASLTADAWQAFVLVIDRELAVAHLYRDGFVADDPQAIPSGWNLTPETAADFTIGNWGAGSVDGFPGDLDEIAIYPLVLTPAQVANHYALGTADSGVFAPTVTIGAVTVTGAFRGSTLALTGPSVVTEQAIATVLRGSSSTVFVPTVIGERAVTTVFRASTSILRVLTVSGGTGTAFRASTVTLSPPTVLKEQTITTATRSSSVTVTAPLSVIREQAVTTGVRASTVVLIAPRLAMAVRLAFRNSTVILSTATVLAEQAVTTSAIGSTVSLKVPLVGGGIITGFLVSTATLRTPTVIEERAVTVAFRPSSVSLLAPRVARRLTTATRASTATLYAPVVVIEQVVTTGTRVSSVVLLPPLIGGGAGTAFRGSTAVLMAPTIVGELGVTVAFRPTSVSLTGPRLATTVTTAYRPTTRVLHAPVVTIEQAVTTGSRVSTVVVRPSTVSGGTGTAFLGSTVVLRTPTLRPVVETVYLSPTAWLAAPVVQIEYLIVTPTWISTTALYVPGITRFEGPVLAGDVRVLRLIVEDVALTRTMSADQDIHREVRGTVGLTRTIAADARAQRLMYAEVEW